MTFLPEELVDLIADFVGSGPGFRRRHFICSLRRPGKLLTYRNHDPGKARRSLLDFCLVSRQTRISAQRVLYKEPFDRTLYYDWERAYALLRTLNGNERLGHFVRDTAGIDEWLYHLATPDQSEETQEVVARTKSWYQACLMCCPNLRKVDLLLSSSSHDLSKIFQALYLRADRDPGAFSPLATLREPPYDRDEDSTIPLEFDYTHVFNLLSLSSIRSLDEVYFGDVAWLRGGPRSTSLCFPFPVKALSIHSRSNRLADSAHLFPKDPSTLRHLVFDGPIDTKGMDLLSLSSLVGPHLESLSLSFLSSSPEVEPRLSTYAQPSSFPRIPLDTFSTFPHLVTLDLRNFHGPSLRFLETLARKSPLLRDLSFMSSRWIADTNPLSNQQVEIFPEVQILATLRQFRFLERIHLGTLPTLDPGSYSEFADTIRESGIKVEYGVCDEDEEED